MLVAVGDNPVQGGNDVQVRVVVHAVCFHLAYVVGRVDLPGLRSAVYGEADLQQVHIHIAHDAIGATAGTSKADAVGCLTAWCAHNLE